MGKYIRGSIDEQLSLTTLAARTLVGAVFDETVNERTLVSSIVASWSLRNASPASDVGPVLVGIAHSDYTDAEVEAYIEASGTWDEGDKIQQEIMKRQIRQVGTLRVLEAATLQSRLADGRMIKTKLNWILNQGQTLRVWAYNLGQAAFATTVPVVDVQGHANLWPR